MNDLELMNLRKKWYSSPETLIEMVKNMGGREVSFLESKTKLPLTKEAYPVRCVKAHALIYLQKNFEAFNFLERPYNLYTSIAKFENMPMFSYAPKIRDKQKDEFFQESGFEECFKGYDIVLDLDSKEKKKFKDVNAFDVNNVIEEYYDIAGMFEDAKKVKKIFDNFGLAYSVKWSGLKGIHFQVRDENFFPKDLTPKDKVELARLVVNGLKDIENISCIDTDRKSVG
jgi:hypothetical protein